MSLGPMKTPQRIPPQRLEHQPPINQTTQSPQTAPINLDPDSLTKDGYGLQEQLDQLVDQFEQLRTQLRQAQKLASIGTTAAMIAHEFNNLFTPVVAYAQQALDRDDVDLMRLALTKTLERTETVREMADRLIGLAKQPNNVIKTVNLLQIVENAIGCLGRDMEKDNISVNIQIDSELAVRANENQLTQVLFNLIINARQAMLSQRGRLTIDAAPIHDGFVQLNVRDTGCGISPENIASIFEPFFSTKQDADKPEARGLGLGLAICQDIIEELGGEIDVSSEPNVGTTFTISLPQAE